MRLFGVLLLAVCAALAQSYSAHSGWSFTDTLETATDVLVADISAGSAADNGSQVAVQATLHSLRVLRGSIAADTAIPVRWTYRPAPFEPPSATAAVPHVRGLWFLRKNAEGSFEVLQAGSITPMGGYFLPLGTTAPVYAESDPLQTKVAREIAAAIEDLVAQHAAELTPHRFENPHGTALAPGLQTRNIFHSLQMALQLLNPVASREVYRRFSSLPDPNLQAIGILGRLSTGDTSAAFDLERNLSSILSAMDAVNAAGPVIMGLDLSKDLPAAHALARIALGDTPLPGLEGGLPMTLARTGRPEFLPYFMTMLESPEPGIRDSTLMGFCLLLKDSAFWIPSMSGNCPSRSPLGSPDEEHRYIQFWKEWWTMHRDDVARAVTLPEVYPPARYGASRPGFRQIREVPVEARFEAMLNIIGAAPPGHYHAGDGSIVNGPPPAPHDPVSGQLNPADREVLHQVMESVNSKLAEIQASARRMADAARATGTPPSPEQGRALNAIHQEALKVGLDSLKSQLSPDGWLTVERFLKTMAIGVYGFSAQ
jgi:hypothetical protein